MKEHKGHASERKYCFAAAPEDGAAQLRASSAKV